MCESLEGARGERWSVLSGAGLPSAPDAEITPSSRPVDFSFARAERPY